MPGYSLFLTPEAEEDFKQLNSVLRKRIYRKLEWLQKHFDHLSIFPLTGPWQGFFKLRIGDWRIIYSVDYKKSIILVSVIDRRDKIYKFKK